jgi:hypothetical protein
MQTGVALHTFAKRPCPVSIPGAQAFATEARLLSYLRVETRKKQLTYAGFDRSYDILVVL